MQSRDESSRLREQTKLLRLEFLKMELVTCSTFAGVAETARMASIKVGVKRGPKAVCERMKKMTGKCGATCPPFFTGKKEPPIWAVSGQ